MVVTAVHCYLLEVSKTVILSEDTVASLLEAHASLAAWYYQLAEAARHGGIEVTPPSDEQRAAYLAQAGSHFPEVSQVAAAITAPRPYIPPPVISAPKTVPENVGVETPPPPPQEESATPPPPPVVDPSKVKY